MEQKNEKHKVSWRRRVFILVVSYFVVFIFIFSFVEINKANWFILAAPFQPIAFLLAGLVAAPLVLAFLWERIRSVKIGELQIDLVESEKDAAIYLLTEMIYPKFRYRQRSI